MNGITVLADLNRHLTSNEQHRYVFNKIEEYPKLYQFLKSMISGKLEKSTVIIQNQQLLAWVQEINHFEPNDMVRVSEFTLLQYVVQTWGITPPGYLNDEDLKQIIDIFPHLKYVANFENSVLQHYFHFTFEIQELSLYTLEKIFNADYSKFDSISRLTCIRKILTRKKEDSIKKNKLYSSLLETLFENPDKFIRLLTGYVILQNYPFEVKSRFLQEYLRELSNLDVRHFKPAMDKVQPDIINAVSVELNGMLKNGSFEEEEFVEVIQCTSGLLRTEYDLLTTYIRLNNQCDRNKLVNELKLHFEFLLSKEPELSAATDMLISPPFPTEPSYTDIESWIKWATTEFLPYRYWLDARSESDSKLDDYGLLFSKWVAKNYLEIKFTYPNNVMRLIPNIKQTIDQQSFTVMLVIDNLGMRWNSYLLDLFKTHEFEAKLVDTYIAAVPTETKISKTSLLSSNTSYAKRDQDYRKLAEQKINEYFQEKQITYVTKISDLSTLPKEANFIIINYLMIDEYMHADQSKMANSRFDLIRNELKSLIDLICKQFSSQPSIDIFVVSDHGSTRITEMNNVPVDHLIPIDKIEEITERYIRISDNQLSSSRKWLENIGNIFEQDKYELDSNYVIANGYQVFKKVLGDKYIHGGITPEELLVPMLHVQRSKHTINHPHVYLKDNIFRFNVKSRLSFIFENTNTFAINNVRLIITSPFISAKQNEIFIEHIDSLGRTELDLDDVRIIRKGDSSPTELSVTIHYQYGSLHYHLITQLPISIKSIQENSFDFDF